MQAYRIGASSREKRKLKELQEHFAPLIAPYEARIADLEAQLAELKPFLMPPDLALGDAEPADKRGPGRPPKT